MKEMEKEVDPKQLFITNNGPTYLFPTGGGYCGVCQ